MSEPDWKIDLGFDAALEASMAPFAQKGLQPARVSLVYRKQLKVWTAEGEAWARTGGKVLHRAKSYDALPAVGDWVAVRPAQGGGEALVYAVLDRNTAFVRKVPGQHAAPHVLAANISSVFVVMGLDQDFNPRRLERYLTLAWESRAAPVVVLNKMDLAVDLPAQLAQVRALAKDAGVFAVNALDGDGLEALGAYLGPGTTLALLGSSGVGKSTLVNRLAGTKVMETGDVRSDGRGRHTTTRRELVRLPGGGSVIDTPGLREVQLWDAQEGLAKTFDDIEALAPGCRFADCRHDQEPGCAVRQALTDGALDQERYESYRQLQKELDWLRQAEDTRGRLESRRKDRVGRASPSKKK